MLCSTPSVLLPPLHCCRIRHRQTQHDVVAHLGPPYVYNVDLGNPEAVVAAAEKALHHRFASYVPWQFTPHAVLPQVCHNMIEANAVCDEPGSVATLETRNSEFYEEEGKIHAVVG